MPAARTIGAVLALLLGGSLALSSKGDIKVSVMVPKEAELSKSAKLECNWKLNGNASLYSVKWYKDEYEFFSYNPDNRDNTITTRILNGVVVDERASKKNEVMLTDLTLNSTGQYKCEVSTDAPFYHTNYSTGHLTVISLPSQGPEIRGLGTQYALGENVTANCTAWPSVPQAKLHWTVNNKEVPDKYVIKHKPHSPLDNQGTPNSLGLRLELESRHMAGSGGTLRVRCVSHVASRRQEVEQTAKLTHANNQRYSAGDLRSRASIVSLSSIALLAALLLT
ncbi:uncharacterized protein LOC131667239 isoform X2 [Phymastichus coffea]|uniref:uncharacterized protein LOC131667239 isoform X2 n=1 Tax=Phymastichus coffea TaxID=108790 RepID=UPI00273B1322|nr:uncharacterized protein LOC131667239 isoform X2 [Phymastichus coffea]